MIPFLAPLNPFSIYPHSPLSIFLVGGRRMNLLFSRADVMRSGYLHPRRTHDFVIDGEVEVWTLGKEGTIKTLYGTGSSFVIEPYVPHILHFLRDTSLIEWNEGKFECYYYHPYRRVVEVQNSRVCKGIGTFSHLVPMDIALSKLPQPENPYGWYLLGVACGGALGFFLSRQMGKK
jgi:hypothetical protein